MEVVIVERTLLGAHPESGTEQEENEREEAEQHDVHERKETMGAERQREGKRSGAV